MNSVFLHKVCDIYYEDYTFIWVSQGSSSSYTRTVLAFPNSQPKLNPQLKISEVFDSFLSV